MCRRQVVLRSLAVGAVIAAVMIVVMEYRHGPSRSHRSRKISILQENVSWFEKIHSNYPTVIPQCSDFGVNWRRKAARMEWTGGSGQEVDDSQLTNSFHTRARAVHNPVRYECEVFAVKYDDGLLLTNRGEFVPVFVFIEEGNVPAFSDVDFTADDLHVFSIRGKQVIAVDGEQRVWNLSPKWRGGRTVNRYSVKASFILAVVALLA